MTGEGSPHACASCRWASTRPRERPCCECDADNNEWDPVKCPICSGTGKAVKL